jgi:hypothetical protein
VMLMRRPTARPLAPLILGTCPWGRGGEACVIEWPHVSG